MKDERPLDMFEHVYGDVPAEVRAQREELRRELEGEPGPEAPRA
jgi:hypothetical protein